MKTLKHIMPGFFGHSIQITALLCVLWFAGCYSSGYKRSDAAAFSLQAAVSDVQIESNAINAALAALNELVNKPSADRKPQFERFADSLDHLVAAARRTERTGQKVERRNAAYFDAWQKELATMNYQAIRERSDARLNEVKNRFDEVNQRYREAAEVVQPLITYLEDIRTALGTDLTAEGIDAVKPIAANADRNARIVQTALARLSDDLSLSSARMSSAAIQPPAAAGQAVVNNQ